MAFESLSDKLSQIFKKIKGQARITESNVEEMLKEIRIALLEADVNFKVVKNFVKTVEEKCIDLKDLALMKGGFDNITIVLVKR